MFLQFHHHFDNGITFNDSISTDTPNIYVVDDDDYNAFHVMDFMMRDPPVSSKLSKVEYDSDLAACTMKHLKTLKHQGKRSSVKKHEFAKLCMLLYSKKVDDLDFMDRMSNELCFETRDEFLDHINTNKSIIATQGRPMCGIVERQEAYNVWKEKSEISNDRRNARHMIKIKPSKCNCTV